MRKYINKVKYTEIIQRENLKITQSTVLTYVYCLNLKAV